MKVKFLIPLFIILVLSLFVHAQQNDKNNFPYDWKIAAKMMVDKQIKDRGVVDPKVLDVISNTPDTNLYLRIWLIMHMMIDLYL